MYDLLKSLFLEFLLPLPMSLTLLTVGTILWLAKPKRKVGRICVLTGLGVLLVFSLPFFPNMALHHLEGRVARFTPDLATGEQPMPIRFIVVLAGGHVPDPGISITSRFSYDGLVRLVEGLWQYKKNPGSKLVLSGGPGPGFLTDAEIMAELALDLGVPGVDILQESKSLDTFDQAKFLMNIVHKERFLLVTSAYHMPRAMSLFKKLGMSPLPVPTGYIVKRSEKGGHFMPSSIDLEKSDHWLREILSIAKEKILGHL